MPTHSRPSAQLPGSSSSLLRACFFSLAFVLLLAVVEGLASLLLVLWATVSTLRVQGNPDYTVYDAELGWVSPPNLYRPDVYGPGMYVRTNSQGFRNSQDLEKSVAPGKRRIICSGASYTFGYGVDNERAWCHVLQSMDARLETVNLGQGGYGLDQIYLRYRRDGAGLDHQLQVLAFTTDNFRGMHLDSFYGYGKPKLELDHGQLMIRNVPVPMRSFHVPWLTSTLQHLRMLRTTEVLAKVIEKLPSGSSGSRKPSSRATTESNRQLVSKVLQDLNAINRQRSSKLVLVYLPTPDDYVLNDVLRAWEAFVEDTAVDLDVPLINLIAEHRQLGPERVTGLFDSNRHYSIEGNAYVAKVIHRKLVSSPELLDLTALHPREAERSDDHAMATTERCRPHDLPCRAASRAASRRQF